MPGRSGVRRVSCRVEFYAGSRAEETPRRLRCGGRSLEVERVLSRRRVFDTATGMMTEEFTLVAEGRTMKLRRTRAGRWSLLLPRA